MLTTCALLVLCSVFAQWPTVAFAASPFTAPASADELAQDMSPTGNPTDYSRWWTAVAANSTYTTWFWHDIMPNNAASTYRTDVAATFWTRAIPGNWAPVANIGGWPWSSGGYYTQWLWLHAVPEGWDPVPDSGGWISSTGGYYAQYLWLHAVPDNVASVANVGGWAWSSGGYYTQWLWLHAIPDNWAFVSDIGGWAWPTGGYYTQWFWLHAVPGNVATRSNIGGWSAASGGYYTQWLWLHAVPDNWMTVGNVGGWPWSRGGWYTQWLWLHAIPDNWAVVPDVGGWPAATGGWYTQWFWLHAVPDNWAAVRNIGGWAWSSGGYYTQWLWLHAVPDSWAPVTGDALGHVASPTSITDYAQTGQGYYRYWFWESAVPDGWRPVANIGGWTSTTGGWYTQWFWLHAVPDGWTASPAMDIDGKPGAGYYDYTFYTYATIRDFAWRTTLSLGGSQGAGYYDYWYHGWFGQNMAHYRTLLDLAGGYLQSATTFVPVTAWYSSQAQVVVALTFDTEGAENESCAVASVLRKHGVTATFYVTGYTANSFTSTWIQCLAGMDVEDHTADHPGAFTMAPQTFMDTLPDAEQQRQLTYDVSLVRAKIPTASMAGVRVPWCDSSKSLDGSVLRNAAAAGMTSDSSVLSIPAAARQAGVVPALGIAQFSLSSFASPYVVSTAGGKLVELPATYPSDWAADAVHGLDNSDAPAAAGDPTYAVTLWEREFDEIASQHGLMVLLMHPWLQAMDGQTPTGLDALLTYMQAAPGVVFTTTATASKRYHTYAGI